MKVIACLGRKGGSGKTMTAHLLAHGLSKGYGLPVNVVMTDVREESPMNFHPDRSYFLSAITNKDVKSDLEALDRIFVQTQKIPQSVLIIDGGANRANVDRAFAQLADFIMIPVACGEEDVKVAEADFWGLIQSMKDGEATGEICVIRNRWPGSGRGQERLHNKAYIKNFLAKGDRTGMFFPDFIPDMPSLLDMANANDPKTTPLIDAVSCRFAEIVARKVGIDLPERLKLVQHPSAADLKALEAAKREPKEVNSEAA
jgi:cellulose biosynthesis protein BcsQ